MASLFPVPQQYFDNNGDPLAGGKVYFYAAGTTTPKDTYTTQAATPGTENTNPVILDAAGRAAIWGTGSYKEVVYTSADVLVQTTDNVTLGGAIDAGTVTNAMLADMAANTVKVRAASTSGVPSDTALSASQLLGRGSSGNIAAITMGSLVAITGTALNLAGGDLTGKGFTSTAYDAGTQTTGTFTPAASNGNLQRAVNGGAHTLAPPANDTTIIVQYTNNGSAGAITTSGFTKVDGSFTTTNGDDFMCYITRVNSFTHLNIVAMQ